MRVLLEYCFDHDSAVLLYSGIAELLRRRGIEATVVQSAHRIDAARYDVLISHDYVDKYGIDPIATRLYGGRKMARPEQLAMIADARIPAMPWSLAACDEDVLKLFGRWKAQRLLLKRSGTGKGDGVTVFDRHHASGLTWDPRYDLFCPELNESDGDVYKIEIFNGRIILGWVSRSPPLSHAFTGITVGVKGAYGLRELIDYPRALRRAARGLSRALTNRGVGYASLDLMKDLNGNLLAIELNTAQVATWWTTRFAVMRWRYARAASELVEAVG